MRAVVFDTETQGLPLWREPSDHPGQPHLVQLAMIALGDDHEVTGEACMIVKPDGWTIPDEVAAIHGITTERAMDEGIPIADVIEEFQGTIAHGGAIVAHNLAFDHRIMRIAHKRCGLDDVLEPRKADFFCTMHNSTDLVRIPSPRGGWKWPTLTEATRHFFGEDLDGAHDALVDARAAARIYRHLMRMAT